MSDDTKIIHINGKAHRIPLTRFPYFMSFISFELRRGKSLSHLEHAPIPHLDAILQATEPAGAKNTRGMGCFFDMVPPLLKHYEEITETLDMLCYEGLSKTGPWGDFHPAIRQLKQLVKTSERGHRRGAKPQSSPSPRPFQNAAFRFIYRVLRDESEGTEEASAADQAFLLLQSLLKLNKPALVGDGPRKILAEAYVKRFGCSVRQAKQLQALTEGDFSWEDHPLVMSGLVDRPLAQASGLQTARAKERYSQLIAMPHKPKKARGLIERCETSIECEQPQANGWIATPTTCVAVRIMLCVGLCALLLRYGYAGSTAQNVLDLEDV